MSNIVYGGKNVYGYDIGVLMLDSHFPRIIGDVGNVKSWNYPVLFKKVENKTPTRVVLELTKDDIQPFIDAAKQLEEEGVSAITTSCGFLALFQKELAEEISIPVFTSSLIMLPMISCMIGKGKKVLILTANSDTLTTKYLNAVCGDLYNVEYDIIGTQHKKTFSHFTVEDWDSVDLDRCEKDILDTIDEAIEKCDSYGAILLECTNMPPYSDVIRKKYNLPVFDFFSLANFVHSSIFGV